MKQSLEAMDKALRASMPTSNGDVARGVISAGLALAAVLLGAAALFSRRISKPIGRLTLAARTMAEGDLSVRVSGFGVREINELAEAFNSMAGSIAHADSRRRQLTADVAHELRTPLSILKGRLEGMQDGVYATTPDQIALLLNETALLERLIEDLRLLAQADAGQLPLYAEQVCPQDLLQVSCGGVRSPGAIGRRVPPTRTHLRSAGALCRSAAHLTGARQPPLKRFAAHPAGRHDHPAGLDYSRRQLVHLHVGAGYGYGNGGRRAAPHL